jgi:surfeit locus 1 family protein
MNASPIPQRERPRGLFALIMLGLLAVVFFLGFVALGTWQVERRAWKLDLIARVDQHIHAPAIEAPGPAQWPRITIAADEYRRVQLQGTFLYDRQTYVWATTEQGSGYWVITPLRRADGSLVLVNRGFVLPQWCGRTHQCAQGPSGETRVTGLLRMSEPGVFLRRNDPARDEWYTRDVPAIAAARKLSDVAPYFVDADATSANIADTANWPRGGMTVISFPNNHLVYLITWYMLALMVLLAAILVGRNEYRLRKRFVEQRHD